MKKRIIIVLAVLVAVIVVGVGSFYVVSAYRMSMIAEMSFDEMIAYTTQDNDKAVITVGIIQDSDSSFTVYGENGAELPQAEHIYEIGSLTKTFTALLLFKAVSEGKANLDDNIDMYLDLPEKDYYPTLRRLVTHTSGFKAHYVEPPMIANFFSGKNELYNISGETFTRRIGKIDLEDRDYDFIYSNFGYAVIGAVLETICGDNYTKIMNEFITSELELGSTKVSDGQGDLGSYWDWAVNDAYLPAGALTSTIGDMLRYAQLQLNGFPEYVSDTHNAMAAINATTSIQADMNIRMDSIGAAWMIDSENNIIWFNGGTGDYNSYLGFDTARQIAVVILSNLPPDYRASAVIMGAKLLTDLQQVE